MKVGDITPPGDCVENSFIGSSATGKGIKANRHVSHFSTYSCLLTSVQEIC